MLLTRMSRRMKFAIALGTITLSVLTAVFVLPVTAQFVGLDLSSTIHTYPWEQQAATPMKSVGGIANRFDVSMPQIIPARLQPRLSICLG
jgi:hypothetical protein